MYVIGLCSFIGINKKSTPQFYVLLCEEETNSDALHLLWLPYPHQQEEGQNVWIPFTLSKTAIGWLHFYSSKSGKKHKGSSFTWWTLPISPPTNNLISTSHFGLMETFLFMPISLVIARKGTGPYILPISFLPNFLPCHFASCNSTVLYDKNHFHSHLILSSLSFLFWSKKWLYVINPRDPRKIIFKEWSSLITCQMLNSIIIIFSDIKYLIWWTSNTLTLLRKHLILTKPCKVNPWKWNSLKALFILSF